MSPNPDVHEVLLLEPDRMCAAVLSRSIEAVFPRAVFHSETEPTVAAGILAERSIDLFVVTVRSFDLDVIALLGVWADQGDRRTRVLVVTPNGKSALVAAVQMLPISGVFDWNQGDLHELEFALQVIGAGSSYWSRTIRERVPLVDCAIERPRLELMHDGRALPLRLPHGAGRLPRRFRSPWWKTRGA